MKKVFVLMVCLVLLSFGCSKKKEIRYAPTEAETKLTKILSEEFHHAVVTRTVGKTFWIYLPVDKELFNIKYAEERPSSPRKFTVQYLDGNFADQIFNIEYDIIPATKSSKGNGVTSDYTEEFNKIYRDALEAITRTYLDAEGPPDFIVLVIADIKNGVEIVNTMSLEDYKKYQIQTLPYEEYILRFLNESKGGKGIVGDAEGTHLDYKDIVWGDFLMKQMLHRIGFKYQSSDFEPSDNSEDEILKIVQLTTGTYQFTDFNQVKLTDVRSKATHLFDKNQLGSKSN